MTKNKRILIVDKMHESILPLLREAGYDPDYQPNIKRAEILETIPNCVGLIIRSKTDVDQELIDLGKGLKFIARAGAGMDKVDAAYLNHRGIHAINAPEGNRDALGEHTLVMLLSLTHKIGVADKQVKQGIWSRESNRGYELRGKTVGIYGYGYMGSAFAEKLSVLGCRVIAYDKFKSGFSDRFVQEVSIETFKNDTEILSIHVPLTEETHELFDYQYLKDYPNLKILLNTARGQILVLADVVKLLEEGQLDGVGLDVLENERLSTYTDKEKETFKKLIHYSNVIITPHVAGWSFESYERINQVITEKLKKLSQ